ncbi:hypothetical protein VTP01DRAFT_3712 [Rhizomucor pusillus]|uniref:uncharacterized protein n=1 Tax=Rhizomucor pusillus TaxID=4840 RepID=UPI003743A78A
MTMENKRPAPSANGSGAGQATKKVATTATRQLSLTSMFAPVKKEKKPEAEESPKDARQLFKDLDNEIQTLLELEMATMHYEWVKALKTEFTKPYFLKLKKFLKAETEAKKQIFPPEQQIYSWSKYTPLSNVKVVILGQDPYHGPNQAHGLCFSVRKGIQIPPSLQNIYKAIQTDYPDFKIPNHGYLENWAKQGVLMLNTSLTVRRSEAGSHSNAGWEQLTDAIITHLNEKKANIVFMLWGAHAQRKGAKIDKKKHLVLKAVHPSPLSAHRGFFSCGHFKQANEYLVKNGRDPINWNCLCD